MLQKVFSAHSPVIRRKVRLPVRIQKEYPFYLCRNDEFYDQPVRSTGFMDKIAFFGKFFI